MTKKIKRGAGMSEYEAPYIQLTDPPDFDSIFQIKPLKFHAQTEEMKEICEKILDGDNMHSIFEEDSPKWFASNILKGLKLIESSLKDGPDPEIPVVLALDVGYEWAIACVKWRWEREVLTGKKLLDSSSAGAEKRKGRRRPETEEIINEMSRLIAAGQSQSNAARIAAEHGIGRSAEANRQAWARHKKVVTHP